MDFEWFAVSTYIDLAHDSTLNILQDLKLHIQKYSKSKL